MKTIPVEQIEQGQFFRKRTGTYVFLRMSPSSVKHLGLEGDNQFHVYGVCFNGNVTKVKIGTEVVSATVQEFLGNIKEQEDWNRKFSSLEARVANVESKLDSVQPCTYCKEPYDHPNHHIGGSCISFTPRS